MKRLLTVSIFLGGLAVVSTAANLNLDYSLTPSGPDFEYTMTLSVDETTSAWSSGMGWSWITFGDVSTGSSPLADFTLTSAPPGPWDQLDFSSGGHNGPTWLFGGGNIVNWVPTSASETLVWTGTSSFEATPGSLFFSELIVAGGASQDIFKEMTPVPEPASLLVLGLLAPMVMRKRKARK